MLWNKWDWVNKKEIFERFYSNFYLNGFMRSWSSRCEVRDEKVIEIDIYSDFYCVEKLSFFMSKIVSERDG